LPLPEEVGDAFHTFGNAVHWIMYLPGENIGNALAGSLTLLLVVGLARLMWFTLLYFRIPILSNVMNVFRANVDK